MLRTRRKRRGRCFCFRDLRRLRIGREDHLRAGDLAAKEARDQLSADGGGYISTLKPKLTFHRASKESIGRLQELSNKTNQFNLSLARITPSVAASFVDAKDRGAVGVALSDMLSDSGVILSLFGRKRGDGLVVEDLCVSCRALGRGIEDVMILEAAVQLAERLEADRLVFRYSTPDHETDRPCAGFPPSSGNPSRKRAK